jgi:hypothetical protein
VHIDTARREIHIDKVDRDRLDIPNAELLEA